MVPGIDHGILRWVKFVSCIFAHSCSTNPLSISARGYVTQHRHARRHRQQKQYSQGGAAHFSFYVRLCLGRLSSRSHHPRLSKPVRTACRLRFSETMRPFKVLAPLRQPLYLTCSIALKLPDWCRVGQRYAHYVRTKNENQVNGTGSQDIALCRRAAPPPPEQRPDYRGRHRPLA